MADPGDPGGGNLTKGSNTPHLVYEYVESDAAPFRLLVELIDTENGTKLINKLSLGKILSRMPEYRQNIVNLKPLGRNKLLVLLNSGIIANKMQADKTLRNHNYKAYIPKHFIAISGVVTGVPVDMTIEEILDNMISTVPILGVTRLHRYIDGKKTPATRIGVTFRSNKLPAEVRIFCCNNIVKPFISKAIFCSKCLRYNHNSTNCRSRQRCGQCAKFHEGENYNQCDNVVQCLHCRAEGHQTGDYKCPERMRQNNLKIIMAKTNLTVVEAREQFPIYTQNQYNLLENCDEHPTLTETYANKVKTNMKTGPPKPRPQHTKRGPEDNNQANMTQNSTDKKRKTTLETSTNGVALFNKYKVNEKEKQMWKKDMKATQQRYETENPTALVRMEYGKETQDISDDEDQEFQNKRGTAMVTSLRTPEEGNYEEQVSQSIFTNKIRYNYPKPH